MAKYKLKHGSASVGGVHYNWKKNNIIETDERLATLFPEKFEALPESFGEDKAPARVRHPGGLTPSTSAELRGEPFSSVTANPATDEERVALNDLTVDELRQVAEADEIDVPAKATKKQLLEAILANRG